MLTQFLERLEVIQDFLVRHGISGYWVGIVIVLVIILLLMRWFATGKHTEDEGSCSCTDSAGGRPCTCRRY